MTFKGLLLTSLFLVGRTSFLKDELKLDLEEQFARLKFTSNGLLFTAGTFMDKSCEALALPFLKR